MCLVFHSRSKIRHAVVKQLFTAPVEEDVWTVSSDDETWKLAGLDIPVGDETTGYIPGTNKGDRWRTNFPQEA